MNANILAQLLASYLQPPQDQGAITNPQRVYPVPPYASGAIDRMVRPGYRLPNDQNTFMPNIPRPFQEDL